LKEGEARRNLWISKLRGGDREKNKLSSRKEKKKHKKGEGGNPRLVNRREKRGENAKKNND